MCIDIELLLPVHMICISYSMLSIYTCICVFIYVQVTESGWDKVFEVNVKSTFFLIKEVVPYMEKRR